MSWLARSFVKTLRGDEEDDHNHNYGHENEKEKETKENPHGEEDDDDEEEEDQEGEEARGVKEDISELTKTLTRQFWGVASFLAPPPPAEPSPSDPDPSEGLHSPRLDRIRSDFSEIGGKFRSGISMLSNAKAVTEISKIASTFLPFGSDDEEEEEEEEEEKYGSGAVGVTDEVVAFANNVSMHPETWLDFPLIPDDGDSKAFDLSKAQQEHALAVERLAPVLASLRIELCPSHMSNQHFWKIYFVLLHSRLSKQDAELLSTPQIVQAREMLLQDVRIRNKTNSEGSDRAVTPSYKKEEVSSVTPEERVVSSPDIHSEESTISVPITDLETDKHPVQAAKVEIIDKSVIEEDSHVHANSKDIKRDTSSVIPIQKYEDDGAGDDWLEEETDEASGTVGNIHLGNDEDVSFSDLEDYDDQGEPKDSKTTSHTNKGSTGWSDVDDIDDV